MEKDLAYWDRLHVEADRRKPFAVAGSRRKSQTVFSECAWRKQSAKGVEA